MIGDNDDRPRRRLANDRVVTAFVAVAILLAMAGLIGFLWIMQLP